MSVHELLSVTNGSQITRVNSLWAPPFYLLLCISLFGCTTYQELGFTGGVTALQLNANTWIFKSLGNAFSNEIETSDFLMLKAAETALDNGFTHFAPLAEKSGSKQYVYSSSGTSSAYSSCGSGGCSSSASASGPTSSTYYKPEGELKARFIKVTSGPSPGNAISAELIYRQLAPKYIRKDKLRTF